ncbi:hypothetical protein DFH08DRAFT_905555 [Mycena albidolilacea]|uniref:Uncharacterized protein n=1 Tax=Mycena albidolilacea TaxID=1033008 RepID=A0AAD7E803_9AGAR|nr:hypothetical protein DFH08DRAFT_905555 [Mycena albidolilacea]
MTSYPRNLFHRPRRLLQRCLRRLPMRRPHLLRHLATLHTRHFLPNPFTISTTHRLHLLHHPAALRTGRRMLNPFPTSTTQYMDIVVPLTGVGTTHQCNQSRISSRARQITNHHHLMRLSIMMIWRRRPSQLVSGPYRSMRPRFPGRRLPVCGFTSCGSAASIHHNPPNWSCIVTHFLASKL